MRYLLCLTLVACSSAPFSPKGTCSADVEVFTEGPRDCECLAGLVKAAHQDLIDGGLIEPNDPLAVTLWVRTSDDRLPASNYQVRPWGRYDPGSHDIELERLMRSASHEMLHYVEISHGVPIDVSRRHEGWQEKGYYTTLDKAWWRGINTKCN